MVLYLILDILKDKDKGRARARDTATPMNMTIDLDTELQTDPTYEDTTEKAVEVCLPLSALISDQMKRLKSVKPGKKIVYI